MLACQESYPHVLTVPLHKLTAWWWDAHRGLVTEHSFSRHGQEVIRPDEYTMVADCTHYCNSPFLYQPLWWALGLALRTTVYAA